MKYLNGAHYFDNGEEREVRITIHTSNYLGKTTSPVYELKLIMTVMTNNDN